MLVFEKASKERRIVRILHRNGFAATCFDSLPIYNENFLLLQMCNGNVDSSSIQYHNLATPAVTKSITVNPFQWKDNVGLRMELYGCEPGMLYL